MPEYVIHYNDNFGIPRTALVTAIDDDVAVHDAIANCKRHSYHLSKVTSVIYDADGISDDKEAVTYSLEELEQALTELVPNWKTYCDRVDATRQAIIHCWAMDIPRASLTAEIVTKAWSDLSKLGVFQFRQ